MRKLLGIVAVAALTLATNASAITIGSDGTYLDSNGFRSLDTGLETVSMNDFGTGATMSLLLEMAAFADSNSFGIYGYTNSGTTLVHGAKLEIYKGSDGPVISTQLAFDSKTGTITNSSTGQTAAIGTSFGFYITTPENFTFYTQQQLNQDGKDHFKIYDTRSETTSSLLGSNFVLAMEDLYGLGDADYNDMVVGMKGAAPVPEPGTMVLLGTALLGLAIYGKRKIKNKNN